MILGVDEVGRGCLAGPVVAGAVILDKPLRGLKDSKKLTKADREKFDKRIRERAVAFGLGWVTNIEIDALGMTAAVALAMKRAVESVQAQYDEIIIDGNYNYLPHLANVTCIIKADDLIPSVSAASVIAKVARDNYMAEMAKQYPDYKFESHVGYATPAHRAALTEFGICDLHRRSFAPVRAIV
ncbi:MAG TPA: ribonuclease HII [Candidatus Saccharimonadales bacterium]